MSMPYFALYPVDFLADVGHLGNTELGLYWRLLLVYYRDGKPLPCDTDRLRRIAMAFSPEENRCLDAVVSEFFVMSTEPDGTRVWRNRRADREIERAISIYANKVGGAEKARAARAAKAAGGVVGAGAVPQTSHEDLPLAPPAGTDVNSDIRTDIKPDAAMIRGGESEPESDSEKDEDKASATPPTLAELLAEIGGLPKWNKPQSVQVLEAEGVPKAVARSWMAIRKPLTPLAWARVKRQAELAGMTPAEAVSMAVERTWCGFEADWLKRGGTSRPAVGSTAGMNYKEGFGANGEIL